MTIKVSVQKHSRLRQHGKRVKAATRWHACAKNNVESNAHVPAFAAAALPVLAVAALLEPAPELSTS